MAATDAPHCLLPPRLCRSEIEQQIQFSLKGLTRHPWKDLGGEKRVALQVWGGGAGLQGGVWHCR